MWGAVNAKFDRSGDHDIFVDTDTEHWPLTLTLRLWILVWRFNNCSKCLQQLLKCANVSTAVPFFFVLRKKIVNQGKKNHLWWIILQTFMCGQFPRIVVVVVVVFLVFFFIHFDGFIGQTNANKQPCRNWFRNSACSHVLTMPSLCPDCLLCQEKIIRLPLRRKRRYTERNAFVVCQQRKGTSLPKCVYNCVFSGIHGAHRGLYIGRLHVWGCHVIHLGPTNVKRVLYCSSDLFIESQVDKWVAKILCCTWKAIVRPLFTLHGPLLSVSDDMSVLVEVCQYS